MWCKYPLKEGFPCNSPHITNAAAPPVVPRGGRGAGHCSGKGYIKTPPALAGDAVWGLSELLYICSRVHLLYLCPCHTQDRGKRNQNEIHKSRNPGQYIYNTSVSHMCIPLIWQIFIGDRVLSPCLRDGSFFFVPLVWFVVSAFRSFLFTFRWFPG